ncbi:hypothetical protein C8J56DRAFT_1068098 [Mycena floridula]|nr:hypothetical protein C8J56DRAFT_1068098 [Mycena floridula]
MSSPLSTIAILRPRFPLELFRPITLLCDCPVTLSSLSLCNKALNHEAAPALYREIHFTNESRQRGTASSYLDFIEKASHWCKKFVLKGCFLNEWMVVLLLRLHRLVELHFDSCGIEEGWPSQAFDQVQILQVTEIKWDCMTMQWALQSCPNATEATLIYAGAILLPGNHCLWTADSPEVEPGEPRRPSGSGLGLLRVKMHVDFQELFLEAIAESGIALGGITQLQIDIWGPNPREIGSDLPNIILAPRIFVDLPNLVHVSVVGNFTFVLSSLVNQRSLVISVRPERISELITTMRDLPLLPKLEQYLIKVLVHELMLPWQHEDDWLCLDERIWSDKRKHQTACGRAELVSVLSQQRAV